MILINFSHPITKKQSNKIEELTGNQLEKVIDIPVQFDNQESFLIQYQKMIELVPLSKEEWQTSQIVVNLPSLNFITAILLAELHGRMGYFPTILRTRPTDDQIPPHYEIAEILNLQTIRDHARQSRYD